METAAYIPKDPLVEKALSWSSWFTLVFLASGGGFFYVLYAGWPFFVDQWWWAIPIALVPAVLITWWALVHWFAYWLPRVNDPDQLYKQSTTFPHYAKIYQDFKMLHPVETHYRKDQIPEYHLPIIIKQSRIAPLILFLFFVAVGIIVPITEIQKGYHLADLMHHVIAVLLALVFWLGVVTFSVLAFFFRSVEMKVTDEGLHLDDKDYTWDQIANYAVFSEVHGSGKSSTTYWFITVTDKSGNVQKYDIGNLALGHHRIDLMMNDFMLKHNG